MPAPRLDARHRRWSVTWASAALALTPKCVLCVTSYLGLGTFVGLAGPELCGGAPTSVSRELLTLGIGPAALVLVAGLRAARRWRF